MIFDKTNYYLSELVREHNLLALKAEFEAEGIGLDELALFSKIGQSKGVDLTVKIGGPYAQRDMHEAWQVGASNVLVPMIESVQALKHADALYVDCHRIYSAKSKIPKLLINIETITAVENSDHFAELLRVADVSVEGIVIGRSDLSASMDLQDANSSEVTEAAKLICNSFNSSQLTITVGGSISANSYESLLTLAAHGVTAFETRKCTISNDCLSSFESFQKAVDSALHFELNWLLEKASFMGDSAASDLRRVAELKNRIAT